MQIDRKQIEKSLKLKGFIEKDTHHKYYHFIYNGKDTGISTHVSHGTKYKVYTNNLLKFMKIQLKLDTNKQLSDLLKCPMDEQTYINILKSKSLI